MSIKESKPPDAENAFDVWARIGLLLSHCWSMSNWVQYTSGNGWHWEQWLKLVQSMENNSQRFHANSLCQQLPYIACFNFICFTPISPACGISPLVCWARNQLRGVLLMLPAGYDDEGILLKCFSVLLCMVGVPHICPGGWGQTDVGESSWFGKLLSIWRSTYLPPVDKNIFRLYICGKRCYYFNKQDIFEHLFKWFCVVIIDASQGRIRSTHL